MKQSVICLIVTLNLFAIASFAQDVASEVEVTIVEDSPEPEKKSKRKSELTEDHKAKLAFEGIRSGDLDMAKKYVFPQFFFRFDKDGENPLTLAIKTGIVEMVGFIEQHAIINRKNKAGETPLILAIKSQNPAIISIVTKRAKASLKNNAGEVPIVIAIESYDNMNYLQQLIKKGAKLNTRSNGESPLSKAVELNKLPIVALLIKNGADPSFPNEDGTIPLTHAVQQQQAAIAGMLLFQSKNPEMDANWKTDLGSPILVLAANDGNHNIVKSLLDAGADPNATDYLDNTALTAAAEIGHTNMMKLLLEEGADINHQNMIGMTPIALAAASGHADSANFLADNGATVDTRSFTGIAATDFYSFNR